MTLNSQSKIRFLTLLVFLCFLHSAYGVKDVSYDGFAAIDARYIYNEKFPELFTDVKLEVILKLTPKLKVEVDLRGNSIDKEIELREVHGTFKPSPDIRIKAGNIKRMQGLEQLSGRENLFTIRRAQINRYITLLGYLTRDPGVQVSRTYNDEIGPYSYYVSATYNQSATFTCSGRMSYHNLFGCCQLGLNGIYQLATLHPFLDVEYEHPLHLFALSLDVSRSNGPWYYDFETFFGMDPFQTEMNQLPDNGRNVYYGGAKTLAAYRFAVNSNFVQGIEPVVLLSILAPDTRDIDVNRLEILGGINLHFDKHVSLRLNGDLILANSEVDTGTRDVAAGSKIILEYMIKW